MSVVERAAMAVEAARAAFADAGELAAATQQDVVDLLAMSAELGRIADAQRVRLAGAVAERSRVADDSSICRVLGARSANAALASAFGIRGSDAASLLSMAAATSAAVGVSGQDIPVPYPRLAAALDDGELSLAQARAIVTTLAPAVPNADLEQLAWAEGLLVDAATAPEAPLTPELLVVQARAYAAVLDPDGVLPNAERQQAEREFSLRELANGSFLGKGTFTPEGGSALKAVLDANTAPRVRVRFTDDECEGAAEPEIPADDRTTKQKRHDALVAMAEAYAASGAGSVAGGEVPRLVLTGTIEAFDAYVRGIEHPDRALTVEHTGSIVPIETADRLLCDGVVQRAVLDAEGHVLDLGREQRLFSAAQRRALALQYGGCATPGCGFPVAWTEAHHVVWWSRGGRTDTKYGILLCKHCHSEVHAGRLLIVGTPGHWRVVPQLRPNDRYARVHRTGRPLQTSTRPRTAGSHAPPPLAVKLPDAVVPPVEPAMPVEPAIPVEPAMPVQPVMPAATTRFGGAFASPAAHRAAGPVEAQLRRRLRTSRRSRARPCPPAFDRPPTPQLVLRT
ncbi:HNH endonuclease signature motif containing protein [Agrococcus baldri]|uniref:HNH nuclease domain-containing protein n=1 Tax=Agrococcus baldri TaxID=153730 RepID=A0AA87R9X9_9MICO|nr:HNH endonuclease signature motif containing protein [Agrococcus baldri]GEK79205.1 hypothetical protein ABA31_05560 [Agrococcus baldri]